MEIILNEFKNRYNDKNYGTFGAIDYAINELKTILVTKDCYEHSVLISSEHKAAIYTGLCNRSSKTGRIKKKKDKDDISKICTC